MSMTGFIGAGNMAGAMVRGLLSSGYTEAKKIMVSDPWAAALEAFQQRHPGILAGDNRTVASRSDVVVIAVKPQYYSEVCAEIKPVLRSETLVVTIAAGVTLADMEKWLGPDRRIVRTMPNAPAQAGEGMTAFVPNGKANAADCELVRRFFGSFGRVMELREPLLNPFTAVAGSSPAWVFMFIEALADGAVLKGIPRDQAVAAAAQAVLGSAKMLLDTGKHPGELKDMVCSPGGTTIAAVAELEKRGFRSAVMEAVRVCTDRAAELSGS